MELTPIGWLQFSEAAELYDRTWLGDRPSISWEWRSHMMHLLLRSNSEPLTDSETKELRDLLDLNAQAKNLIEERLRQSRYFLHHKLYIEVVGSMLLHRATGDAVKLPGRFWASSEATKAIAGKRCSFYLNGVWWEGPVLISEADVIKTAAPILPIAHAEAKQTEQAPSGTLTPLPGEAKQAFIMRTLRMPKARRITHAEGRQLAKRWLESKKLPADTTAIEAEMKRMTSLMRMLAPKPEQTKAKPKAKPVRSVSE